MDVAGRIMQGTQIKVARNATLDGHSPRCPSFFVKRPICKLGERAPADAGGAQPLGSMWDGTARCVAETSGATL